MVEIFDELGYKKQTCKTCGQEFYSQVERDTCGDAPCDEYGFIANPATTSNTAVSNDIILINVCFFTTKPLPYHLFLSFNIKINSKVLIF